MKRLAQVPLSVLSPWLDDRLEFLTEFNDALRNINRGRNDHLPYYEALPGYKVLMISELKPRGENRAPSVGRWQLVIQREDRQVELVLQGLVLNGEGFGDLVVLGEDPELLDKFLKSEEAVRPTNDGAASGS